MVGVTHDVSMHGVSMVQLRQASQTCRTDDTIVVRVLWSGVRPLTASGTEVSNKTTKHPVSCWLGKAKQGAGKEPGAPIGWSWWDLNRGMTKNVLTRHGVLLYLWLIILLVIDNVTIDHSASACKLPLSLDPIIQTYTVFLSPLHLTTAIAGCQPLVVQFVVKPDSKI
jgi:hypothetical protein